jgi:excisionase family DNA binding protein
MFCTFEEAAEKLGATTAEVETMVADGTLHEYRVGATRLVKTTEVDAATASRPVAVGAVQATPDRRADARSDPPPAQQSEGPGHGVTIKPPADAAIPSAQPESNRLGEGRPPARPAAAPSPDAALAAERDYDPAAYRRHPARAVYRPMPRLRQAAASAQRRSLRQWMWMGIVDDQPHVLITLFAIVTGCIGGLAAAAYLLTRWL